MGNSSSAVNVENQHWRKQIGGQIHTHLLEVFVGFAYLSYTSQVQAYNWERMNVRREDQPQVHRAQEISKLHDTNKMSCPESLSMQLQAMDRG